MDLEDKIILCLRDDSLGTLSIAKKVIGKDATKSQINPTLYSMEKRGLLIHHQKENIHMWSVNTV